MLLFDEKCSNKNSLHPKMIIEEHNLVEIGEDTKSLKVTYKCDLPFLDNLLLKRIIVNCPSYKSNASGTFSLLNCKFDKYQGNGIITQN